MSVTVTLLSAGHCTQSERVLFRGGEHKTVRFPAMFALFEHPTRGPILFDTGYSLRFFDETQRFPNRLYAWATPVHLSEEETAVRTLARRGIGARDVQYLILSHFHADHIGAVRDFPKTKYIYSGSCFEAVHRRRGLRAVLAGFLAGLLPPDFTERSLHVEAMQMRRLPPECGPFEQGIDLFGDQSVMAVALPGHTVGQIGVFVRTAVGTEYFLIADACWHSRAFRERILPSSVARFVTASWRDYKRTLDQVHQLHCSNPTIRIIPSHCTEVHQRFVSAEGARIPQAAKHEDGSIRTGDVCRVTE